MLGKGAGDVDERTPLLFCEFLRVIVTLSIATAHNTSRLADDDLRFIFHSFILLCVDIFSSMDARQRYVLLFDAFMKDVVLPRTCRSPGV